MKYENILQAPTCSFRKLAKSNISMLSTNKYRNSSKKTPKMTKTRYDIRHAIKNTLNL